MHRFVAALKPSWAYSLSSAVGLFLLDSISAVVVGATSLFGGRGGIPNTILGLFVLGVLNNGLDHIDIDSFLKILIRGLILLLALVINVYAQKLRQRA
jgi:ribose transport system permease protein